MKKVFFAFVAASVMVLAACNNTPKTETPATTPDTSAVKKAVETTSTTDTTKAAMDTTAKK